MPGIDLKTTGCYVVAPPSIHPDTGRQYQWELGLGPDEVELAPVPAWLLGKKIMAPTPSDRLPRDQGVLRIVMGERNWRLAQYAGMASAPAPRLFSEYARVPRCG